MIGEDGVRDGGRWHQLGGRGDGGQGASLAKLVARQLGGGPGTAGSWSRLLAAHGRWIVAVTLVVVAGAAAFAASRTPLYRSQAEVVVQPAPGVSGGAAAQQPDMGTETSVVTSGAVLGLAARAAGVPESVLAHGVSVAARGASYVLQISYSASSPQVAQQRAQAIAQAYTSFRSPLRSPTAPTAPTATVITPASLPTSPYSPDYLLDIGAALIVGLALAVATAWGRDHLDDRLRGPLDLERRAGTDLLALVPAFRPHGPEPRARLAVAVSPDSIVAEAYRGLRTRVLLAAAAENARTLLVASPAWEDRGTVAANLAAALAQAGHSTVLVCADLRWGSAHLLLGSQKGTPGLTGVLEQQTGLAGALETTVVPGLALLAPGAVPPDPAALLAQPALREALNELRHQADFVVIEAPPLLAGPDALPLAESAEMTLLIADARETTRAQVRAAARELQQEHLRLAGCVLISVGRPRRLTPGIPSLTTAGHTANGRPRHAAVEHAAVEVEDTIRIPRPGTALAGRRGEVVEDKQ